MPTPYIQPLTPRQLIPPPSVEETLAACAVTHPTRVAIGVAAILLAAAAACWLGRSMRRDLDDDDKELTDAMVGIVLFLVAGTMLVFTILEGFAWLESVQAPAFHAYEHRSGPR